MKKKILVVYPHNFFARRMGADSRFYELITYFKSRNFEVDLFSLKNFVSSWENQNPHEEGLISEVFFCDFAADRRHQEESKKKKWLIRFLKQKVFSHIKFNELPDYAFDGMKKKFKEILSAKQYDFIVISYVYWADLIDRELGKTCTTVLTIEDFITLSLFDISEGKIEIGKFIEEEIRRVNLFRKVICISEDERFFFSQFARNPQYYYIPFFMKKNKKQGGKKDFDVLFIGSDNAFNKKGMNWFFEKVYPLLNPSLQILIVGNITSHVPAHDNVTCIPFAPDLEEIYNKTKIPICPLLGGTGLKVKVIEALSFGLPVVTTSKGVVGFPCKSNNGCLIADTPEEFAKLITRLLADQDFYKKYSEMAKQYFIENFEESKIYKRLDKIFLQAGE